MTNSQRRFSCRFLKLLLQHRHRLAAAERILNEYKISAVYSSIIRGVPMHALSNSGNIQVKSEPINVETIRLHIQYVHSFRHILVYFIGL